MEVDIFQDFVSTQSYQSRQIKSLVGGRRIIDLLLFPPFDYKIISEGLSSLSKVENEECLYDIIILKHEPSFKISSKSPYKIEAEFIDGEPLIISFFAGNAALWKNMFKENKSYKVSCKIKKFGKIFYTHHPKIIKDSNNLITNFARNGNKNSESKMIIDPKYPLTSGLTQYNIKNIIKKFLPLVKNFSYDLKLFDEEISFNWAILNIHAPKNIQDVERARQKLAFEEIFAKNIAFLVANFKQQNQFSPSIKTLTEEMTKIQNLIPFALMKSQTQVLQKIFHLQEQTIQNTILLQGDVGSGKTIIAILAAINVVLSTGMQVAVMSPTLILAKQNYEAFLELSNKVGISCLFFSGEDKGKKRLLKLNSIKCGEAKIVIGTHALFSDDVEFQNLGYSIIDEQHRFGINQRLALTSKSLGVKTLLISATPIPRTLSMALFGEIEVAYLQEKPKNRKQIITKLFSSSKFDEILEAVKRKVQLGELIYWVVPLISESENEDFKGSISIEMRLKTLEKHFSPEEIGVVHGKMKETEILSTMEKFKAGEIKILLATTVIEVGVNVPAATLIIIEDAENFGLSTLHQLRGRVGRGNIQSYCFLLTSSKIQNINKKLKILTQSSDGFFIAEKDMELRGDGGIFSKMQSGFESFKFLNLNKDQKIIMLAKKEAKNIINIDPELKTSRSENIKTLLKFYNHTDLLNYYKI